MVQKMRKRLLAIITAIIMIAAGIPMSAYAAVGDGSLAERYVKIEETQRAIAPGISDKKMS